jgi:hypothetical protein
MNRRARSADESRAPARAESDPLGRVQRIGTGDISKDDFPQLPTQSPHTLERACTTKLGYCRVANLTPPGQPCYCLTSTGARVDGYVIAYRFTDVPSTIR